LGLTPEAFAIRGLTEARAAALTLVMINSSTGPRAVPRVAEKEWASEPQLPPVVSFLEREDVQR